jgi:hypothetical protein
MNSRLPLPQRFMVRIERPDDVVMRTGGTAKVLREKLVCVDPFGFECQLIEEILVSVKALEASGRPNITSFLQARGDFKSIRLIWLHLMRLMQDHNLITQRCAVLTFPLYVACTFTLT